MLQSMGSQRVGHDIVTEREEEVGEWRKHQGLLSSDPEGTRPDLITWNKKCPCEKQEQQELMSGCG